MDVLSRSEVLVGRCCKLCWRDSRCWIYGFESGHLYYEGHHMKWSWWYSITVPTSAIEIAFTPLTWMGVFSVDITRIAVHKCTSCLSTDHRPGKSTDQSISQRLRNIHRK